MEIIPTAEEFTQYELTLQHINLNEKTSWKWSDVQILMITYAKLHVTEALKQASKEVPDSELVWVDSYDYSVGVERKDTTYKNDVLHAYPLKNIK